MSWVSSHTRAKFRLSWQNYVQEVVCSQILSSAVVQLTEPPAAGGTLDVTKLRRALGGWSEVLFVSKKFVQFLLSDQFPKGDPGRLIRLFAEYNVMTIPR